MADWQGGRVIMKPVLTNRKKGAFLAVLSALFYSMISVCVKWIGGTLPTVEVLFFAVR